MIPSFLKTKLLPYNTKYSDYFFTDGLKVCTFLIIYYYFFLRSTQGGEITVYRLTETAWQVSSVGLYVEKHRHDYRLKYPPRKTRPNTT